MQFSMGQLHNVLLYIANMFARWFLHSIVTPNFAKTKLLTKKPASNHAIRIIIVKVKADIFCL